MWVGVSPLLGLQSGGTVPLHRRNVLNFPVENVGFCALLLRESTCGQKPGLGGLIAPLGARDEKPTGVEKLAGVQLPQPRPLSTRTMIVYDSEADVRQVGDR